MSTLEELRQGFGPSKHEQAPHSEPPPHPAQLPDSWQRVVAMFHREAGPYFDRRTRVGSWVS